MSERGTRIFVWSAAERAWSSAAGDADAATLAATRGAHVAQIWFDDDAGVTLHILAPEGLVGELSIPFLDDEGSSEEDLRFVTEIVARGLLSKPKGRDLGKRLRQAKRRAWFAGHGLEALFGFPDVPLAEPKSSGGEAPAAASEKAATRSWTPADRAIVDLHVHYWACIWSMNNFSLYNRYKKHLPASARRDVDRLANAAAMGNDDEIRGLVERVLAETWDKEDWGAIIRSPKLDDAGTDPEAASEWRRMIGRAS